MTEPGEDIQRLVYSTLKADAAVMALVNGVYDRVPADPWGDQQGYISFGPSDMIPDDADCVEGEQYTFQLDAWSRQVGQVHCRRICAAVKNALHLQTLTLTDHALVDVRLELLRVMADPDEQTTHGAMQFSFAVERYSG